MLAIRLAEKHQFDDVFNLIRENMYPLQIELGLPWDEVAIQRYYRNKDNWIVTVGGKFSGSFSIENKEEHIFVHTLQIVKRHQNKMLGYQMLKWIVEETESKGIQFIRCCVFENNSAKHIYHSLGFKALSQSNGIIDLQLDLMEKNNSLLKRLRTNC